MTLKLIDAQLGRSSYSPGQALTLRLRFQAPADSIGDVSNVSVDLLRAEKQRNQQAFGFGHRPTVEGNDLVIVQDLPADFKPGLHIIGHAILSWPDAQQPNQSFQFGPLFFAVSEKAAAPLSAAELEGMIDRMGQEREAYAHKEIPTQAATQAQSTSFFRVLVLGVGCLLHRDQPLEGFRIYPLRRGFSYGRMLELANQALKDTGIKQLGFDAQVEAQHEQATPTFAIEYWRVRAVNHQDALDHCRRHADLMFDLLGLNRGQKPREFFCAARDEATGHHWFAFTYAGYAGNLVSDFNPVATANLIETVTPRLESNPFLRLLVRSYAEATAERDPGIGLLRVWTVLELLADRAVATGQPILHLNGTPIVNAKGNPKDTNAKEARVYEFIRNSGAGFPIHASDHVGGIERRFLVGADATHPGFTSETRIIPLWDLVRAAYAIRNRVAHEGNFSVHAVDASNADEVLAADLINNTPIDPRRWVREQAWLAVQRELHKP